MKIWTTFILSGKMNLIRCFLCFCNRIEYRIVRPGGFCEIYNGPEIDAEFDEPMIGVFISIVGTTKRRVPELDGIDPIVR